MHELTRQSTRRPAVPRKADGNPEGKGSNGFLLDWYRSEPRGLVVKPRHQVLAEFFTSMLVLSAKFSYKPAIGVTNYLYRVDGDWSLSLIAPNEWSRKRRAGFVGTCRLQRDMTWTIAPSKLLGEDNPVTDAVRRAYDAFARALDTDLPLEEILPFHADNLRYYQRLYANALSRSVRGTVTIGNQATISCRSWQLLLPRLERVLLTQQV